MKTFVKKVFCFVRKTACREHGDGFIQKQWKAEMTAPDYHSAIWIPVKKKLR